MLRSFDVQTPPHGTGTPFARRPCPVRHSSGVGWDIVRRVTDAYCSTGMENCVSDGDELPAGSAHNEITVRVHMIDGRSLPAAHVTFTFLTHGLLLSQSRAM